jgi:hypothetical protein
MKIEFRRIGPTAPYAANPRKNDLAVAAVVRSITEFGWRQPTSKRARKKSGSLFPCTRAGRRQLCLFREPMTLRRFVPRSEGLIYFCSIEALRSTAIDRPRRCHALTSIRTPRFGGATHVSVLGRRTRPSWNRSAHSTNRASSKPIPGHELRWFDHYRVFIFHRASPLHLDGGIWTG